jgi:hypothetical protein
MKKSNKTNIFKTPEGYFEDLPERILLGNTKRKTRMYSIASSLSAAAVILLGIFLFVLNNDTIQETSVEANLNQEIDLYISSGYWQAEDILSLGENPNEILDEIISMEWGTTDSESNDQFEDDWWY